MADTSQMAANLNILGVSVMVAGALEAALVGARTTITTIDLALLAVVTATDLIKTQAEPLGVRSHPLMTFSPSPQKVVLCTHAASLTHDSQP